MTGLLFRSLQVGTVLLLSLLFTLPAMAEPRPVVLIVDSSGSMAAEMAGETRLDVARRMIVQQAASWAADGQLALVAYGHRREGDCTDIETLLPLGPVDVRQIGDELDKLRARGKTPLSASLIEAWKLLPNGGAIILVSDGLETCNADPCAIAAGLHQSNVDVAIHVIGFGLTEPELAALSCIAANAGGQLIPADSGASLALALERVSELAVAPPEPVTPEPVAAEVEPVPVIAEPEPAPTPIPTPIPIGFVATSSAGPEPAPVAWTVTPVGGGAPVYEGGGQAVALDLLPGQYTVALAGNNVSASTQIAVTGPTDAALPVPLEAGHLLAHLTAGGGLTLADAELPDDVEWTMTPLDGQQPVTPLTGLDPSAVLAPGRYRLIATAAGHSADAAVTITAGATSKVDLSLALGRLSMALVLDAAAGALTDGTGLAWSVTSAAGGEPILIAAIAQPTLIVPAGEYTVTAQIDGADVSVSAVVVEGEEAVARISMAAGTVTLEGALGPGAPVIDDWRNALWTVTPVDLLGGRTADPALSDQAEARPVLSLLPGEWEATLKSGSVTTTRRFTVNPGEAQTIRVEQAAGLLRLQGRLAADAEPFSDWRDVQWTIRSADGATTIMENMPELVPAVVVPVGEWVVTLVSGGARLEQTVTVAAGDDLAVAAVLDAGRVSIAMPEGVVGNVVVSALDAGGNPLAPPAVSGVAAPLFPTILTAGQYLIEVTTADGRYASAPLELAAGDSQQINLTFD